MAGLLSRSSPEAPARGVVCRRVTAPDELAQHFAIRHAVFVEEQRIFADADRDAHDDDPATQHVLGYSDGVAAGAVRLYPLLDEDPRGGLWQGDRLAVLPGHRSAGLGGPLVRFAVRSAAAAGGRTMLARVQLANVTFFRRLGWTPVGEPTEYVGQPHQQMSIALR